MRLSTVERGESFADRALFALFRMTNGHPAPDELRLLRFRPERFGRPFSSHAQGVLRGPSSWTVGEREAMAAFVSSRNGCLPSTQLHGAVASLELGDDAVRALLESPGSAPVSPRLRAVLAFLERRGDATAEDLQRLEEAGVDDAALDDALAVAWCFDVLDRLAQALAFSEQTPEGAASSARALLRSGYD